ncbi:MAM and LDL-receptor class A domain-containing protein 2-like, partial [Ruditapes philippinarum]|uniref:MAM and LDL-receptor class A domain-containing protein 2-like n=1 Tax=Ruditapes philippinarum TaxID=129788 RepID=UPI00295A8D57
YVHIYIPGYVMFANGKDSTHAGDIVKFQSKSLKFPPGSHIEVGFSYIFSEAHTHPMTLSVYVTSGGQSQTPNWVKTGHLSSLKPRWHRVCFGTTTVSGDVTVVFEAKVSYNSNNGNLAIDDVVIEPGTSCHLYNHVSTPPPSITTTTHSSANVSSVTCNFDLPSICGYLNRNSGDNFNWLRHQMATQSVGTGPNSDHSSGEVPNPIDLGQRECIQITHNVPLDVKIVFEGGGCSGYQGDIAIDDVFWIMVT